FKRLSDSQEQWVSSDGNQMIMQDLSKHDYEVAAAGSQEEVRIDQNDVDRTFGDTSIVQSFQTLQDASAASAGTDSGASGANGTSGADSASGANGASSTADGSNTNGANSPTAGDVDTAAAKAGKQVLIARDKDGQAVMQFTSDGKPIQISADGTI